VSVSSSRFSSVNPSSSSLLACIACIEQSVSSSHSCPSRYLVDRLMLIEISLHSSQLCLRADPLVHRLTSSRPTRSHPTWVRLRSSHLEGRLHPHLITSVGHVSGSPALEGGVVRSSLSSILTPLLLFFGFVCFSLLPLILDLLSFFILQSGEDVDNSYPPLLILSTHHPVVAVCGSFAHHPETRVMRSSSPTRLSCVGLCSSPSRS
jgi:hypothetical protein